MSDVIVTNDTNVDDKQYIIFNINKESYGIDIMYISSIIMMPEITEIPLAPDYLSGIISLRGKVIPVIDMHKKMNYGEVEITKDTRIIIININEKEQVGIIVDSVKEVVIISNDEIEHPSPFVKTEDSFISGVGKKDDILISIFDIDSLVNAQEIADCVA